MAKKSTAIDVTQGVIWQQLLSLCVPIFFSSFFQQAYTLIGTYIVGQFGGKLALGGIQATMVLTELCIGFCVGVGAGCAVITGQYFGQHDDERLSRSVHTAMTLALVGGIVFSILGIVFVEPMLVLMNTPHELLAEGVAYARCYFAAMVAALLLNMGTALLRAVGDTRRPLYCLAVSGVINVVLNLVFVILFSMSVAGVALATIISQTVSACMVTALLVKEKGPLHLDLGHLGFHAGALGQILRIGLPAGLQSTVFSLSNVVIQSAVNSFGSIVVAGNSAASNLEGFVYTAMNAFAQAAVTFTSQNMGARRYDNLDRVMRNCLLCSIVTGLVLGGGASLLGEQLLHFYSSDEVVVTAGLARMHIICTTYLLCGGMDVLASCLRGRGYSVLPMVVSLVGSCLLRLVWIATIFRLFHTTTMLYLSYPVSWILTTLVHLACLLVVRHKMNENLKAAAQR